MMNFADLKREASAHVGAAMAEPMIYEGRGYPAVTVNGIFAPLETQSLSGDSLVDSVALWFNLLECEMTRLPKPAHGDCITYCNKTYKVVQIQSPTSGFYRFRCHELESTQYGINQ